MFFARDLLSAIGSTAIDFAVNSTTNGLMSIGSTITSNTQDCVDILKEKSDIIHSIQRSIINDPKKLENMISVFFYKENLKSSVYYLQPDNFGLVHYKMYVGPNSTGQWSISLIHSAVKRLTGDVYRLAGTRGYEYSVQFIFDDYAPHFSNVVTIIKSIYDTADSEHKDLICTTLRLLTNAHSLYSFQKIANRIQNLPDLDDDWTEI